MLWSIIKIVVFIALVAAGAYGAGHLLEMDGGVLIQIGGQEFNLTPLKAVIALVLLMLAVWLLMKLAGMLVALWHFINGDETAFSRFFARNRQERGYQALSEGLMAIATGEGDLAMAKANKAEKYLRRPALTNLIRAQAAEMKGDTRAAESVYKRLLKNEKTRFVGVRGILRQKLAAGETETALKLAQTAFALKPKHVEMQDTLLRLQAQTEDWKGARETLRAKLRHGSLPRDLHKRRDAVLALSQAKEVEEDGKPVEAREAAIAANRMSPDLVPAAVMAAHAYTEQGSKRSAARVLKKAWDAQPHPDLAAAFAAIEPDESRSARLKRFGKLIASTPAHRESRLLKAELLIAAEDFPAARRALGDLAETDPDTRALAIMAAIERGEGASDAVVKGWLARALSAPRGPQWVCENCNHVHAEWTPVCRNCNAFDTLSWTAPPEGTIPPSSGMEMLPLIVGALESDDAAASGSRDDVVDAAPVAQEESATAEK